MGSHVLDYRTLPDLQPATALWAAARAVPPPHGFTARTRDDAAAWQATTRAALAQAVGYQSRPAVPLAPQVLESVDKGDYVREKVLLQTAPQTAMPIYLLLPKHAPRPLPVVLAFHGHGYGVKDIVGLWEDGSERDEPDGYHKDFGVTLCRRGLAVAAPEIAGFGERRTDFGYLDTLLGQGAPTTCAHMAFLAFTQGGSAVGLRVADGKRLVDYLATRPEVDGERLGAYGISGGGMHTFFSACLDPRIKACVVSGYFCTFAASILAMAHCVCNIVPGLQAFGEMSDLAGLIAPRPMLVEAASRDPIFPLAAVQQSVARAREIYRVCGAEGNVETDYFEGRHQIHGVRACAFLAERLGLA
jgi:dienelactone hydrolase